MVITTKTKTTTVKDHNDVLFERKIETATIGLTPEYSKLLYRISKDNALTIASYIHKRIFQLHQQCLMILKIYLLEMKGVLGI